MGRGNGQTRQLEDAKKEINGETITHVARGCGRHSPSNYVLHFPLSTHPVPLGWEYFVFTKLGTPGRNIYNESKGRPRRKRVAYSTDIYLESGGGLPPLPQLFQAFTSIGNSPSQFVLDRRNRYDLYITPAKTESFHSRMKQSTQGTCHDW